MEVLTVITALANTVGRDNREGFKNLLRMLIEDGDSPLNDPERYREGEDE